MKRSILSINGNRPFNHILKSVLGNDYYVTIVSDQNKREKLLLVQKVYNETVLQREIDNLVDLPNDIGEVHGISINEILGFKHYISD